MNVYAVTPSVDVVRRRIGRRRTCLHVREQGETRRVDEDLKLSGHVSKVFANVNFLVGNDFVKTGARRLNIQTGSFYLGKVYQYAIVYCKQVLCCF